MKEFRLKRQRHLRKLFLRKTSRLKASSQEIRTVVSTTIGIIITIGSIATTDIITTIVITIIEETITKRIFRPVLRPSEKLRKLKIRKNTSLNLVLSSMPLLK